MASDLLTQLGVGGAVAYVIVKEVLGFLRNRKEGPSRSANGTSQMVRQISEVWEGVKLSQMQGQGVVDLLREVSKNIGAQTEVLRQLSADVKENGRVVGRVEREIRELKSRRES